MVYFFPIYGEMAHIHKDQIRVRIYRAKRPLSLVHNERVYLRMQILYLEIPRK